MPEISDISQHKRHSQRDIAHGRQGIAAAGGIVDGEGTVWVKGGRMKGVLLKPAVKKMANPTSTVPRPPNQIEALVLE